MLLSPSAGLLAACFELIEKICKVLRFGIWFLGRVFAKFLYNVLIVNGKVFCVMIDKRSLEL